MNPQLGPVDPVFADPRALPEELAPLATALDGEAELHRRVTRPRPPREGSRRAAVLIMISEDDLDITFTERSGTMRKHPGQISFPGGALDEGEGPVEAALREAWEEIGLVPSRAKVLGRLPAAHVAASAFDVAGVVATWDGEQAAGIAPVDPAEVASIHRFRIDELADPEHRVSAVIPSGYRGPAFAMGEIFIWGFTAHLVDCILDLGGWRRPWDTSREEPVPWRFLRDKAGPSREWKGPRARD
ncbi:MAG: CoA pyrophosphatase [Luteococcus sp.]|uniref:NUDIX hydrolase n=1 Tax=Luteococcus sp. TaxID=1969402 RepID=UPI00264718E6|nr:CoA pyrophosphatase [Luteococcus sp.]MDN5564011.1 CoA pyrophosphatase [Luteococcus sp.]